MWTKLKYSLTDKPYVVFFGFLLPPKYSNLGKFQYTYGIGKFNIILKPIRKIKFNFNYRDHIIQDEFNGLGSIPIILYLYRK